MLSMPMVTGAVNCYSERSRMEPPDGSFIAPVPTSSGRCSTACIQSRSRRQLNPAEHSSHPCTFSLECPRVIEGDIAMTCRTSILLAGLLFAFGVAGAQDRDFSKVQMKVSKVSGNVYMLEGAGGNIGASVGDDGIVIVDDQYAPLADKIRAALKGITDKPVRFVINTHYHGDHTGGNAYFHKDAPVIAHDNVRKHLQEGGTARNFVAVTHGIKPGRSVDKMKQANVLAPWPKWSGDFINTDQWLVTLYNDLTGKKTGEFIKHN